MGQQAQPDNSADNAVNEQLAESQKQEFYAQQQAWNTEHSLIQAQGGLNWSSQNPNPTPQVASPNVSPSATANVVPAAPMKDNMGVRSVS